MEFEWDEPKRQSNIEKHEIDFVDIQAIFDGRPILTGPSDRSEESRSLTVGELEGIFYSVIWTWRGDVLRIISARRARDAEIRQYRAVHG
jgi:uncharacterized DUF497 family protein